MFQIVDNVKQIGFASLDNVIIAKSTPFSIINEVFQKVYFLNRLSVGESTENSGNSVLITGGEKNGKEE